LQGLPYGFPCRYAVFFGDFVLCQNDAMALFGIAANRYGLAPNFRMVKAFNRGIKAVKIGMQNYAVHFLAPTFKTHVLHYRNILCINQEKQPMFRLTLFAFFPNMQKIQPKQEI
jgi:hypothetical protein